MVKPIDRAIKFADKFLDIILNKTQLQGFLESPNYITDFYQNLRKHCKPLYGRLRSNPSALIELSGKKKKKKKVILYHNENCSHSWYLCFDNKFKSQLSAWFRAYLELYLKIFKYEIGNFCEQYYGLPPLASTI
jgi:hypothetical protein